MVLTEDITAFVTSSMWLQTEWHLVYAETCKRELFKQYCGYINKQNKDDLSLQDADTATLYWWLQSTWSRSHYKSRHWFEEDKNSICARENLPPALILWLLEELHWLHSDNPAVSLSKHAFSPDNVFSPKWLNVIASWVNYGVSSFPWMSKAARTVSS